MAHRKRKDQTVAGYDKREVKGKPFEATNISHAHGNTARRRGFSEFSRVTSYRSRPHQPELLPLQVDPYAGFIQRANDRKITKLRQSLEFDSSNFEDFTDTGHPFLMEKWSTGSYRGRRKWNYNDNILYPITSEGMEAIGATPLDPSSMPFQFRLGSDPTTGNAGNAFGPAIVPPTVSLGSSLVDFGRLAIARVAPGKPHLDAFRAVGEIFAGLPALPGYALGKFAQGKFFVSSTGLSRRDDHFNRLKEHQVNRFLSQDVNAALKGGSGEFLNYLFGVAPTLTDLIQLGFGLATLSDALLQLKRDAGRVVRRSYRVPTITRSAYYSPSQVSGGRIVAGGVNALYNSGGTFEPFNSFSAGSSPSSTLTLLRQESTWFSGAFSYFLPTLRGFEDRLPSYLHELNLVVNLEPKAKNLWELLPWSWLFDWFVDVKSALDIAEATQDDSLVINYGYAMREQTLTATQTTTIGAGPRKGYSVRSTSRYNRKERIRANPYGFTLGTSSDFTPMRWAILAALGLSRR